MATIRSTYRYPCDLTKGANEVSLRTPLMQSDAEADEFRASVLRNGVPVSVAGMTVYGYLYNAMEQTTILLDGTASGNEASVILSSECYKHPGYASLAIQVVEGDVRHTVLKVNLCITRTGNDYVIDGENVIPTLPDLLSKIGALEQATAAANQTIADVAARTGEAIAAANAASAETRAATIEFAKTGGPAIIPAVTAPLVTISDGANRPAVRVVTHIEPVQEGIGEASHSNVRPFKSWNGATLDITNENLMGGMHLAEILREQAGATINTSEGTVRYTSSGGGNRTLIGGNIFKPGKQYTVILYGRNIGGKYSAANIAIGYTDGSYDGLNFPSLNENSYLVYTSQHGKDVSKVFALIGADTTDLYYDKCGVFEGVVTADALIPAQGKRCSVTLPESLYGADIDWVSGKAYKRYHRIVFDGVTVGAKVDTTDPGATTYAFVQSWNMPKPLKWYTKAYANKIKSASTNTVIAFGLPMDLTGVTSYDSVADVVSKYNTLLKQWHDAGTPLEIVYEVENPEEIQLTPQQINTLKGVNNAWSSDGKTELAYIADTKLYIDQRIAALLNL